MTDEIYLEEKYERIGWPSLARPDLNPPTGWSLPLITSINPARNHSLSPDGETIAFIWDRDDQSDIFIMPSSGGWPRRMSIERDATIYWSDEIPAWSPNGQWNIRRQTCSSKAKSSENISLQ